jgi:hypothetical protein
MVCNKGCGNYYYYAECGHWYKINRLRCGKTLGKSGRVVFCDRPAYIYHIKYRQGTDKQECDSCLQNKISAISSIQNLIRSFEFIILDD